MSFLPLRTSPLLLSAVSFLLGAAAAICVFWPVSARKLAEERALFRTREGALQARAQALTAELTAAKTASVADRSEASKARPGKTGSPAAPASPDSSAPITDFATLMKEVGPLVQRMGPLLSQARQQGQERWMDGQLERWQQNLGLTEAQTASLRARFTELFATDAGATAAPLQGPPWPGDEQVDGILEAELTPEQWEQYREDQLGLRADRISSQANRELTRLTESLDLDESQQDAIFAILVQSSDSFDPAMQIETGTLEPDTLGSGEVGDRDAAIRQVLRPDQLERYDRSASARRGWWGRWGR